MLGVRSLILFCCVWWALPLPNSSRDSSRSFRTSDTRTEAPSGTSVTRRTASNTSRRQTPTTSDGDTGNILQLTGHSSARSSKLVQASGSASPALTTKPLRPSLSPNPSSSPFLSPPRHLYQFPQQPPFPSQDQSTTPFPSTTPSPSTTPFPSTTPSPSSQPQPQDPRTSSTTQVTSSSQGRPKDTGSNSLLPKYLPPKYFNFYLVFSLLLSLPLILFIIFALFFFVLTLLVSTCYVLLPCTS